jgi:hypothetical protein
MQKTLYEGNKFTGFFLLPFKARYANLPYILHMIIFRAKASAVTDPVG